MSRRASPFKPRRLALVILLAELTVGSAMPAWAQTAPTADDDASAIPRVLVTGNADTAATPVKGYRAKRSVAATKTDTRLAETPQSVTVVTMDQIIDQGAVNLQDALNYAAGVRSDAYGQDARSDGVRIRGVSPDEYLDGVRKSLSYYTSSARTDPYTLERIDVLRGAAAMLYGQGGTGGVVNMVSKRPLAEAQNEIGVQFGSYQRKQVQGDFTGPLSEDGKWLYRLIMVKRDANTQVDFVPDNRTLIAPSLTWKPTNDTTLTLMALYQDDKTVSSNQFFPWSGVSVGNPNGKIPTSRFIGEPGFDAYNTKRKTFGWSLEHVLNSQWKVRQNVRYSNTENDYRSLYADSFSLPGGFNADPVNQRLVDRFGNASLTTTKVFGADQAVEGNFNTGAMKHKVLVGVDYLHYKQTGSAGYPAGTQIDVFNPVYTGFTFSPGDLSPLAANTQKQTGLYAQDQINLTSQWLLTVGLRHDRADNETVGSDTQKSSATTKRAGLMYLADSGVSPYVSYSESFTPVANSTQGQVFKPLRGQQWEAGVKYEPVGSNLALNASAYQWKEKNQLKSLTPVLTVQLGSTDAKGVELEARGRVWQEIDIIAQYNYIDLDTQLEAIPKHQASLWAKRNFVVAGTRLSGGAGVRHMSDFKDGAAPVTPAVNLVDAMIAWDTPQWRIALNINNLADKTYVATCLGRGDCWFGARRNAVLSATYRW
ncbi:MAG: TonB-dependent siderophore receptor [Pseudomonadota bacterium]|nr:TonB-dependent siderophore receptor [Pseudomonadota bacterium]